MTTARRASFPTTRERPSSPLLPSRPLIQARCSRAADSSRWPRPSPLIPVPTPLSRGVMVGVNATALMRVRFNVTNPQAYESLALKLAFDDGCVVWLNGVEIARRNAPATLAHDSIATRAANGVETIPLSARLLVSGTNLLAIQG